MRQQVTKIITEDATTSNKHERGSCLLFWNCSNIYVPTKRTFFIKEPYKAFKYNYIFFHILFYITLKNLKKAYGYYDERLQMSDKKTNFQTKDLS